MTNQYNLTYIIGFIQDSSECKNDNRLWIENDENQVYDLP